MSLAFSPIPRVGMHASVRNRRAIIMNVDAFDAQQYGRHHLVSVEYTDGYQPMSETLVWERELATRVIEPNRLPAVHRDAPMLPEEFDALVRATRWSALTPLVAPNKPDHATITAPLFGAVKLDDYQLQPLLKALQMPRISLLIADDVGLGKTIEAGLILNELLLRRRIRRVLILTPASLRRQWRQEMREKFSVHFEIVDRKETLELQKHMGLDANPWRSYQRIISSYHYFKQADVLEQFLTTCRDREGQANLPWDLLIVDEAHNTMPSPFGQDSDLAKMVRRISPYFEHKLFLTATPHNGHSRSFTGMLEQLDPVRFTQRSELTERERARLRQVIVRRLKRDVNERDAQEGRPPRFANRHLTPVPLFLTLRETALMDAFQAFRKRVKALITTRSQGEQTAGSFAIEVLNKRMLSSPTTFADSWFRFMQGLHADTAAELKDVNAARRAVEDDVDDDAEAEGRSRHAAATTGAWLKPLANALQDEIAAVDEALTRLHLTSETDRTPLEDTRYDALVNLIEERLRDGTRWLEHERLIVFTEYKTTLDDLNRRLKDTYGGSDDHERVLVLFGGMDDHERERIKDAFNDPSHRVRVMLATDAASEGLNLQKTARYLLHYEIPWNPSRLEQRNGRLDRHGQARDVTVFHFTSEQHADLDFLKRVVEKVHRIRDDLGSVGEVFARAFSRRFIDDESVDELDTQLERTLQARKDDAADLKQADANVDANVALLDWLKAELDVRPGTLAATLGLMFRMTPVADGTYQVDLARLDPSWKRVVDTHVRLPEELGRALPQLAFDPERFVTHENGRPIYRVPKHTTIVHLGHPIFRQALSMYAQRRFTGSRSAATRWTIRYGHVPDGANALVVLTLEELAINDLRETMHHWVRSLHFPVIGETLADPLPHITP